MSFDVFMKYRVLDQSFCPNNNGFIHFIAHNDPHNGSFMAPITHL